MAEARRIAEAQECIKRAEKHLKTSFISLKFKPDYDSAASEYERAAVCYKNANKLIECRDIYLKAAECHTQDGIIFHAAKCKEQAALLCRDLGDMEQAKTLMEKAAQEYAETGTPETSTQALDKAAKFFEQTDPEKALEVYKKAYYMVQETDKTKQIAEFLNRITKLYMRLERFEEACKNIQDEISMYADLKEASKVGRLTSGLVLVHLHLGDSIAANKCFENSFRVSGFAQTEDAMGTPSLLASFESGENENWKTCLNRPHMKALDNEYLRLMKKIKLPAVEGGGGAEDEEEEEDLR